MYFISYDSHATKFQQVCFDLANKLVDKITEKAKLTFGREHPSFGAMKE